MTEPNRKDRIQMTRAGWAVAVLATATLAIGAAQEKRLFTHVTPGGGGGTTATTQSADASVALEAHLDRSAVLEGEDGLVRMELVLRARNGEAHVQTTPTDLLVVLDRSGSMNGTKIADARAAVKQLIAQLAPEDRFALVTFASDARITVPFDHATPRARERWHHAVDGVYAGGGTYMDRGLDLGLSTLESARTAGRSPRAIVISDGLAAEPHPVLRAQAVRSATAEIPLSAVGVGTDFDEVLMGALADAGTGNFYYLRDTAELAAIFSAEFATARETLASAVKVTLEPGPGVAVVEAAGYPLTRSGPQASFLPGTLFAGQERRIWVTLRVPTHAVGESTVGRVRVEYRRDGELHRLALGDFPTIACVRDPDRFFAQVDEKQWEQGVIVEEYNALRQKVAGLVASGRQSDAEGAIRDFVDRNEAMNRVVASPSVALQLEAASELEADVADAFRGDDAGAKQNLMGTQLRALGYAVRRPGGRN